MPNSIPTFLADTNHIKLVSEYESAEEKSMEQHLPNLWLDRLWTHPG